MKYFFYTNFLHENVFRKIPVPVPHYCWYRTICFGPRSADFSSTWIRIQLTKVKKYVWNKFSCRKVRYRKHHFFEQNSFVVPFFQMFFKFEIGLQYWVIVPIFGGSKKAFFKTWIWIRITAKCWIWIRITTKYRTGSGCWSETQHKTTLIQYLVPLKLHRYDILQK